VILECTGALSIIADAMARVAWSGIVCLTGVSAAAGKQFSLDLGTINRHLVLGNGVVVGSVNANRAHFNAAAEVLKRADRNWLGKMISRRVPLEDWQQALDQRDDDVKVVLSFKQ
jgi:threonine dehydrogenase-like Zn-dependent dehydrogenase